ncbi:unnamed protein product [Closterium sp. Yama58-4]|nr:unnamed protein product [Closterium sp. Yama58-4]
MEVLELPVLVVLLVLEVLVVLALLVQEVLVLEVLELPELEVMRALELETLELEALELEALELEALELEELELVTLELAVLELEALELEALELEVLELLEALELLVLVVVVLELVVLVLVVLHSSDCSSFHRHRRHCHHLTRCIARFLASHLQLTLLLPYCVHNLNSHGHSYSQTPHCLVLLLTLHRQTPLQSVVSLSLNLPCLFALFALVAVFLVHVLLLSPAFTLCHFVFPLFHVPLPSPPASSLPHVPDPESDLVHVASPTVTRLLATVVTDPSFESAATSALVAELVDFAAAYRLDYAITLVAESESVCPPSVGGECALGTDVLEDRQEDCLSCSYCTSSRGHAACT